MLDTSRDALVESTSEVERLAALVEVLLASRDAPWAHLTAEVRRLSGMLDLVLIGIGNIAKP
jgi:hypothetical protein